MLCSCQAALNNVFSYTIGVWRYDEADSNWIEALPFDWDAITKRADCVKTRSQNWYEERCYTERLYVSDSEKWYDASDRCNTKDVITSYSIHYTKLYDRRYFRKSLTSTHQSEDTNGQNRFRENTHN